MRKQLLRHFSVAHDDSMPIVVSPRSRQRRPGMTALARVMRMLRLREGVEVGTHKGFSAAVWCQQNPHLHLTCIDPYASYSWRPDQGYQDAIYAEACERLRGLNATLRREYSLDAVRTVAEGSIDFVLVDGNHEFDYAVQDIVCWVPKVREGGIVAVHDYLRKERGVMLAVDAYIASHRIKTWYVTLERTPMVFWQKGA